MPDGVQRWTFGIGGTNGRGIHYPLLGDAYNAARWAEFKDHPDFALAPWRTHGDHILICGQRGVRDDSPTISCHPKWPDRVINKLLPLTDRPIWYRPHPGRQIAMPSSSFGGRVTVVPPTEPLARHLEGAWACVTWASAAIVESIFRGVPAFYDGPNSVCKYVASDDVTKIETPLIPADRLRETWAAGIVSWQFTNEETASGLPFDLLLKGIGA